MISDIIVWGTMGLSLAFFAAWAWSPALRRRIEQPKYRFLDAVRAHDQHAGASAARHGGRP